MLARIGYQEVEGYPGIYDDPRTLRAGLDSSGLSMPTGHFSIDMVEGDRGKVMIIASLLGVRHIYCPYLAPENRPTTAPGWKAFGKRLATTAEWVRGEGYGFGWHNHDFEFIELPGGGTPHELIFEAAPVLDWECDVAWIARANANPIEVITKYANRITAVHVKDVAPVGECADEDGWADVGKGTLDWQAVVEALGNSRPLHYVMEHDNPADVRRFAQRSYDHMSSL